MRQVQDAIQAHMPFMLLSYILLWYQSSILIKIILMLPPVGGATVLASGAKDNKIRLWTPSGACLALGDGHAGAVSALAFSRKTPSFLVSGGVDKILKVPIALRPPDTSHSHPQS